MHLEPGMRGEPPADGGVFARPVVVANQVRIAPRVLLLDRLQRAHKLNVRVAGEAAPEHLAAGDLERGKQAGGAVSLVVVRHPCGQPRPQRQQRLRSVEGLDLGLLVYAQHQRPLRRVQIHSTMSASFSLNSGSLLNLNVVVRCGCKSYFCQMR